MNKVKKITFVIGSVLTILLGFIAIWKIVIPFISTVFSWFLGAI